MPINIGIYGIRLGMVENKPEFDEVMKRRNTLQMKEKQNV
jgi:hypothetical protein